MPANQRNTCEIRKMVTLNDSLLAHGRVYYITKRCLYKAFQAPRNEGCKAAKHTENKAIVD